MRNNSHRPQILTLDNTEYIPSGAAGSCNRPLSARRRMAADRSGNQNGGNGIPAICYYTLKDAF